MSLQDELSNVFGQLAAQPVETPLVVTTATEITPIVPPTPTPAPAAPVVAPKVETTPVAPVAPQAPVAAPVVDVDALITDWDGLPEVVAPVTIPNVGDLSEIAKALGLGEVKTKEDVINAVTALKIKAEAQSKDGAVLPEDLAKAVDIAKQGGNYNEYLKVAAVDWKNADPVILFQNWIFDRLAKQGKSAEEVEAYLDTIPDIEKDIRGSELQSQYIQYQERQKQDIENQVRIERQERDSSARRTLDSMDSVFGFKLGAGHKEELFNDFSNTQLGRALLAQAGGDYKKAMERLFLSKYGEKVDAVRRKQLKDATKRELLQELQNPNITAPGQVQNLNTAPLSPIDVYFSELRQKTGL